MIEVQFLQHPLYLAVREVSKQRKVRSFLIGGYVRDLILKRPCKDIDIVCEGSGIEFAREVAKKLSSDIHVTYYKNFGTAAFKYDGWEIEFVGARKESYNRDSRKPIVESGSLKDDQERRDFTINALAISINEDDFGSLIDPFDGMADIEQKKIKTPLDPDITFLG